MGATKRYIEKLEEERSAKQEALLDLPVAVNETSALVEELQQHIRDLRARIERDNSWQTKLKEYLISGVVGAVIGFLLSRFL